MTIIFEGIVNIIGMFLTFFILNYLIMKNDLANSIIGALVLSCALAPLYWPWRENVDAKNQDDLRSTSPNAAGVSYRAWAIRLAMSAALFLPADRYLLSHELGKSLFLLMGMFAFFALWRRAHPALVKGAGRLSGIFRR